MNKQCVAVHAGARDHYELAQALAESNNLYRLVTDIYCPDALKNIIPSFAAKRSASDLSSKQVNISVKAFWYEFRMKMAENFSFNQHKDKALGNYAALLAQKRQLHLFAYSYYASPAFALPPAFNGQKKMLFQLHPHPFTIKKVLEKELEAVPLAKASILYENEFRYDESYLQQLASESQEADTIVVASNYTARTLMENGVPGHKITIIPYGISMDRFQKEQQSRPPRALRPFL